MVEMRLNLVEMVLLAIPAWSPAGRDAVSCNAYAKQPGASLVRIRFRVRVRRVRIRGIRVISRVRFRISGIRVILSIININ